jgi:hypothetical protein
MEDAAKIGNKAYLHSNGSLTITGGHFLIASRLDECPEMMEIRDILDIESYIKYAGMSGYQPYWACYCFAEGLPINEKAGVDYMAWIQSRYREFDSDSDVKRSTPGYTEKFTEYLKQYATEHEKQIHAYKLGKTGLLYPDGSVTFRGVCVRVEGRLDERPKITIRPLAENEDSIQV